MPDVPEKISCRSNHNWGNRRLWREEADYLSTWKWGKHSLFDFIEDYWGDNNFCFSCTGLIDPALRRSMMIEICTYAPCDLWDLIRGLRLDNFDCIRVADDCENETASSTQINFSTFRIFLLMYVYVMFILCMNWMITHPRLLLYKIRYISCSWIMIQYLFFGQINCQAPRSTSNYIYILT